MVSRPIGILLPQIVQIFSRILDIARRPRRGDEKKQRILGHWLCLENTNGGHPGLLHHPNGQFTLSQFQSDLVVVRLQFSRLLQENIRHRQAAFFIVEVAQLPDGSRIKGHDLKGFAVFDFGRVEFLRAKILVGTSQAPIFAGFLGASTPPRARRRQVRVSKYGKGVGSS